MGAKCGVPNLMKKKSTKIAVNVEELKNRENIEKRKNRAQLPVMFVKKRLALQLGGKFTEAREVWVAEHIRAAFKDKIITKEYYGTLPFDTNLMPEVDRGFYDDYERSIRYTTKSGQEKIVDCVFQLVPLSEGVLCCIGSLPTPMVKDKPGQKPKVTQHQRNEHIDSD